jgi:hypothetical protein
MADRTDGKTQSKAMEWPISPAHIASPVGRERQTAPSQQSSQPGNGGFRPEMAFSRAEKDEAGFWA